MLRMPVGSIVVLLVIGLGLFACQPSNMLPAPTSFGYDGTPGNNRRHFWLADDSLGFFNGRDLITVLDPCAEGVAQLTNVAPEPIREVVTFHDSYELFLLRGNQHYWLFRPSLEGSVQFMPIVDLLPANDQTYFAFSPEGSFLSITAAEGNTFIVETTTGQLRSTVYWSALDFYDDIPFLPPVWLTENYYLVRGSKHQGPLVATVGGEIQSVTELLGLPP